MAKPIIQLLAKEHHTRQAYLRPTVGQTLLEGISLSQPQPKIPAEMIKYMGWHFHAWHTAVGMLESHVGLFPQDMRCFDALCDLYSTLGEDDMVAGLWQQRAGAPETKNTISLQQHGFLPQAQANYLELMSRGVSGGVIGQYHAIYGVSCTGLRMVDFGGVYAGITKSEMVLWHQQYLVCCMELNQWEIVADYARVTDNAALQLPALAHLHEWHALKQVRRWQPKLRHVELVVSHLLGACRCFQKHS